MLVAAETFVWILTAYAALGALFAIAFVMRGVTVVDPAAEGASWGFRLIILPGAALLWPVLLCRWAAGRRV